MSILTVQGLLCVSYDIFSLEAAARRRKFMPEARGDANSPQLRLKVAAVIF